MLQLLYILAFTVLTALVISNLIRNLLTLGREAHRPYGTPSNRRQVPHPELIDDRGNVIDEPLLVMRSMTVDDAREQLDALYEQSPGSTDEASGGRS